MPIKRPCVDCGKLIRAKQHKSRCKECQELRTKWLQERYKRTRLGSPALFKKLQSGKIIPADYGCGNNTINGYPIKRKEWMSFFYGSTSTEPIDMDLLERERVLDEGKEEAEADWIRTTLYNWKYGIEEHEEPKTRTKLYQNWRYWETFI